MKFIAMLKASPIDPATKAMLQTILGNTQAILKELKTLSEAVETVETELATLKADVAKVLGLAQQAAQTLAANAAALATAIANARNAGLSDAQVSEFAALHTSLAAAGNTLAAALPPVVEQAAPAGDDTTAQPIGDDSLAGAAAADSVDSGAAQDQVEG